MIIFTIFTLILIFVGINFLKKLKEERKLSDFRSKLIEYSLEVSDPNIKYKIIDYWIDTETSSSKTFAEVKEEFIKRFENHIPSLISEKRDRIINNIIE